VTIRTTAGIARDALPATLETLLRMNGATMIYEGNLWKVVPQTAAVRGNVTPQLGNSTRALPQGYSVQIVPLKFVGVRDMLRILEPFAKDAQTIRVDDVRNLLVLSGTEVELRHLLETIDMFDIDWMSGMSAGVFTLQNADVKSVSQELDKLIGNRDTSPFTGILRIIPIERMNALLVISPNQVYIEQAKKWIERLDSGAGESTRFYVYNLQNQRAERVAPLLQQAFTGRTTQRRVPGRRRSRPARPRADRLAAVVPDPAHDRAQHAAGVGCPAAAAAAGAAVGAAAGARLVGGAMASVSCATSRWSPTRTRTRC
jgi:general secretion pathway protein D